MIVMRILMHVNHLQQMCFRLPPVGPIQLLAHSSRGRMAFVHHRRPIDIMIYRERTRLHRAKCRLFKVEEHGKIYMLQYKHASNMNGTMSNVITIDNLVSDSLPEHTSSTLTSF